MKRYFFFLLPAVLAITAISCTRTLKESDESMKRFPRDTADVKATELNAIMSRIYTAAIKGELKTYSSDSCKKSYSADELNKLFTNCETVSIQINPNDPYETIDSTICTPLDPVQIDAFVCKQNTYTNGDKEIDVIAPAYQTRINGTVLLPYKPMFFVKYAQVKKLLKASELASLNHAAEILPAEKL